MAEEIVRTDRSRSKFYYLLFKKKKWLDDADSKSIDIVQITGVIIEFRLNCLLLRCI